MDEQLKHINEQLFKYVTSLLQMSEVNQDQLKTPIKLDLLKKLSVSLQELYSETQSMIAETCKCSEDLKKDFYDFAYRGLRAQHFDLVHRVECLESAVEEMSKEDKKAFKMLQGFQVNRQRQVDILDKLWGGLFKPVCYLLICQCGVQKSKQIQPSFYGRGTILNLFQCITLIFTAKIMLF